MLVFAPRSLQVLIMRGFRAFLIFSVALVASSFEANAQSGNLAYAVANLSEDVRLLDERIRALQLQMEDMQRENDRLRQTVADYESRSDNQLSKLATESQLNQAIDKAVGQLEGRDERMKADVILEVTRMLETFTKKVSTSLAKSGSSTTSSPSKTMVFHNNFPKTGTSYIVKSGDTLSKIASENNSTLDWIQHANKIVSPRNIQVGQRLFIPQNQ